MLTTDQTIAKDRLTIERDRINTEAQLGEINNQQKVARENQLNAQLIQLEINNENELYNLHLQAFQQELAIQNLRPAERQRILNEIEQLEQQHQNKLRELTEQSAVQMDQAQNAATVAAFQHWEGILQPIGNGFDQMFQQMYKGTTSFRTAFIQMMDQLLFAAVRTAIESAVRWEASELAKTAATTSGATTRTAVQQTAAAAGMATDAQVSSVSILNSAWAAMAGAYSAIAAIPMVGPFLAPAAAAAAFAAVAGLAGSVISAEGGLDQVAYDGQAAILHKDESVLPASFAKPLRSLLKSFDFQDRAGGVQAKAAATAGGVSTQNAANTTNFYYNPSHTGGDNLDQTLRRDGSTMRRWVRDQVRSGRLG